MKLTPAKCPSCGANIEVNETLKNAICQYCGTTVLIEEAIEKYKVELSGKVEVEGITTNAKKIETAKKHMLLGEYDKAQNIFNQVNEDDSFNVESQSLWIKNAILMCQLKVDCFAKNFAREDDLREFNSVEMIVRHFDRLKKFDKEKEYEKFIGDELPILEYLKESYEELVADEKEFKEKADKIWSSVGLNIILIALANQLNLDTNDMSWVGTQINKKPNNNWTTTLVYRCTGLKITRNGGIVLYYTSTEYNYSATYYFKSKDGFYTKEQTIEKINKVFDMISDQKIINSINKQLSKNYYKWNTVDLNKKSFFQKLGF